MRQDDDAAGPGAEGGAADPVLQGDVAMLVFTVDVGPAGENADRATLLERYHAEPAPLRETVEQAVRKHLGPDFRVSELKVREGSLEVAVFISATLSIVASLTTLAERLSRTEADITQGLWQIFDLRTQPDATVRSQVHLAPAVLAATRATGRRRQPADLGRVFGIYLMATHALLLAILVWMALGQPGGAGDLNQETAAVPSQRETRDTAP